MPPYRRDTPALLVFIRGRWQSLPPGSKFAVARRGRLEQLRSGTVRGELRRFQMWLPSKARLGPRLPFKKIPPSDRENSDNNVTLIEPKQTTLQNRDVQPCKSTRDTTSSEEPIQRVTTVATVHAAKRRKTSKNHQLQMIRLLSSESKSSEESRTDLKKQLSKEILIKSPKKISETSRTDLRNQKYKEILESPKKSSVSSRILPDSPKRSLSLRRKQVEQTNSSKQSSMILKSKDLSENQISRHLQPRSGKQNSPKKRETVLSDADFETDHSVILKSKMRNNHSPKKINSITNSKFEKNNHKFHEIGYKRQKLNQDISESQSSKEAEIIFQRPNKIHQTQNSKIGTYKELEIDERDIELLRIFLQKHYSDRELLKFDADDDYKRIVFFRINPLVNIEWCPIIDRMLRRSQDSQITLTDFASKLGLTEAASIKTQRYKIRKRTENRFVDSDSDSSSENKENNDKMPRKKEKTKILKEKEHNMRESNTGENKAKESKNKVSNKTVLTRKRAESESEESYTKENSRKLESAKKRTIPINHNTVESDSEFNNKAEKAKERARPENRYTAESDSESSNTKENNKKARNTKKQTESEVFNKVDVDPKARNAVKKDIYAKKQTNREEFNVGNSNSGESNAKRIDRKDIDTTVDTVELSSGSEKADAIKAIFKTAKHKAGISSKLRRTNRLEYSTLEDHAIVAWVSTGARALRVNGNLLWRQLQDQYTQITGSHRTWHSLRNRYLRYILPKLGDLALPLSQQTRLRAAAATGEIKSLKKRSPHRNSIFKLPPRGASSRRLAVINDDTDTENKETPQTKTSKRFPSYSSLTRQFIRRHNQTRPSSELSDNSQRSNKLEVTNKKEPEAKGKSTKKPYTAINIPRKQTNGKASGNEDSDSDRRSESLRRDIDSSDSSSESADESTKTNEPRRSKRSVNEANKRMSRSDPRQNTNESNRRVTRQSNILDESDESKSRKSRGETDKHMSATEKTNESPSRKLNRHKSPSEQNSRDSSESMSQSRRKSPEKRRRPTRHTKNRDESDDESKKRKSPHRSISRSPTRKFNRDQSPSKQSSKGSNTSMSRISRKSESPIKRKNTVHDSSEETSSSDSSNRSVIQTRRKSNRINSPIERSNRRKSNRLVSPMKQNGRLSSDPPRRKSNRLMPNESSNKRRLSSESKRKSKFAKRDSLDEIVVSDSSESFETKKPKRDLKKNVEQPKRKVDKQKMRRLYNPKAIL